MELFFGVKITMAQLGEYYQEVDTDVIPAQTKEQDVETEGGNNVCDMFGVLPSRERETDEEGREYVVHGFKCSYLNSAFNLTSLVPNWNTLHNIEKHKLLSTRRNLLE
jgi:hypothetical protein